MKVKYHRYAAERAFKSVAAFETYASEQADQFRALAKSNNAAFQAWAGALESHWRGAASTAKNHPAKVGPLQTHLEQHPVFPFKSALTRVLFEMTENGRGPAAQEIIPFLKGARDGQRAQQFTVGQLTAHADFRLAIAFDKQTRTSGDDAVDRLLADHEDRLETALKLDEESLAKHREDFELFAEEAKAKRSNLENEAAKFLNKAKADWGEAYESFINQLATDTAVELWSKRANKHEARYQTFRKWVIRFGLGGLILAALWIFGGFALARIVFENDKTAQLAAYTAGSIALFTLLVWGLRVLIRSMMSEDHLCTDASARSALAHTYLALTKEEAATDNDRAIMLATLFAPVSDGLVKDDGMPAFSPAAIVAQAVTKP